MSQSHRPNLSLSRETIRNVSEQVQRTIQGGVELQGGPSGISGPGIKRFTLIDNEYPTVISWAEACLQGITEGPCSMVVSQQPNACETYFGNC